MLEKFYTRLKFTEGEHLTMEKMKKAREKIANRDRRKAVSPVIATLLLIAIAVAAGIVLYVFVSGLTSTLTNGGGSQATEQLSMDAYSFKSGTLIMTLRNVGTSPITLSFVDVYFDGSTLVGSSTVFSGGNPVTINPQSTTTLTISGLSSSAGTSHIVKVISSDGAVFTFTVVSGKSG